MIKRRRVATVFVLTRDGQLVGWNTDDLAVAVDHQTGVRGARDFDGTQPRAAKRSECRECERWWGCVDGHGLTPEATRAGASPALSYSIQESTSGL